MRGAHPERALDAVVRRVLRPDPGARVLVACSGGPDSVALAALLDRLAREDRYEIVLAHVDHGRRASAAQDECVVLSVAARLGRTVRILRPLVERDDEATMREARYAALASLAADLEAPFVATAHTAEDQAETVLLALFRGTGPTGLAGMPPVRPLAAGVELIRPVLRATRSQLAAELRRSALPCAVDPTNEDRRYRRNALRPVLAELRRDFPHLDAAIARCAEIVRDELDGNPRAARRRAVRERLRREGRLRDTSFAEIEAQATTGC
ncbi:MAG: tRNA(Ile)-lysidine synthetase [Candidatus Eremiobacteraeota bacterium]|nr:tRNA(Ile)-lysidine synthetase [Candidatus Eremiobacteraeota bacterium]